MARKDAFDLYDHFESCNYIDPRNYERTNVKRGLRNADGTGVMAGFTNISNVHGYVVSEGDQIPAEGELILRGYNIADLVHGVMDEGRFGYGELVYLLLTGVLPSARELEGFVTLINENRELPHTFVNDHILTAPLLRRDEHAEPLRAAALRGGPHAQRHERQARDRHGRLAHRPPAAHRGARLLLDHAALPRAARWCGTTPRRACPPPRPSWTCCAPTTCTRPRRRTCSTSCSCCRPNTVAATTPRSPAAC